MKTLQKHIYITILFCWTTISLFGQEIKIGLPVGHTDSITDVQYSPSGKFIASLSRDNTAKIWDVKNEKLIASMPYLKKSNEFGFVFDHLILIRNDENQASLYDLKNQKTFLSINHSEKITFSETHFKQTPQKLTYVKIDPSNKFIIGFYQNSVVQFTKINDQSIIEFKMEDGETIDAKANELGEVFGLRDNKDLITLFDESKTQIFSKKFKKLKDFLFLGNDTLAVLYENSIQLWNYKSDSEIKTIELDYNVIDFQPDSLKTKFYFFDKQNSLSEIDIDSETVSKILEPEYKPISLLNFEPISNELVYVTSESIKVINIASKAIIHNTSINNESRNIRVHPKNNSYSIFLNKSIESFSLENGTSISVFQNKIEPVLFASINPLNRKFYFVGNDLKESTLSLDNGKFKNLDKPKTEFNHTPYNYSVFEYISKQQGATDLIELEKLCNITYDNKSGFIGFSSTVPSVPLHIMQRTFGNRLRLNQNNSTENLTLFNNKYLRIGTNQGSVAFQVLQQNIGWSQFKLLGKHDAIINSLDSFDTESDTILISASEDGSIILWSMTYGRIITYYILEGDPKKWVHIHPSGFFDASPEAMKIMYWTKGMEVIEFEQLKDRYWLPGLWEKVMKGEKLSNVRDMNELKLQPEVEIIKINKENVQIHLIKREGGYGKVALFINGKEAISDIRPLIMDYSLDEQTILVSIKDHPYLLDGNNKITVKASSEDGFVQGRGAIAQVSIDKKDSIQPQFFGVIIGVGDYANEKLNLKYTVNDAEVISKAMQLGAENLFNKDRTHIYTITSKSETLPNKENIRKIFKEISKKANAEDIITLYLSGHGITWGGDQGDFYFLTSDATATTNEAYNDPLIRQNNTISTYEWVEWLKEIPALKQVMIIDACGSGKAVDNLVSERDIESSQIKAIDRMKDRTGMYIISGCTADAVSYEASMYGQGLLTYSLLQAIKGAALKEDKYVDIFTIMDYARETVPKLAEGIGGIQEPQLLIPTGGSFDIGMLGPSDKEAIPLASPKTIFIRSTLVNAEDYEDNLGLSEMLNRELSFVSSKGISSSVVYFDSAIFPNACKVSGGYTVSDNEISISLKLRCDEDLNTYNLKAENKDVLIQKIIDVISYEY